MINSITYKAVKGHSGLMTFGKLTVITGRNAAGKSAILTAIQLADRGVIAGLPQNPAGTFQAASGAEMSVQMHHSDDTYILREWRQSGKTVRTTKKGSDPLPECRIPVLDHAAFTAAKPRDRIAMLSTVAAGDWTPLQRELDAGAQGDTPLEQADNQIEKLKALCSDYRAEKAQAEKTLAGIVALMETDPKEPPLDLSGEIRATENRIAHLTADVRANQVGQDLESIGRRIDEILEMQPDAADPPPPYDPELLRETDRLIGDTMRRISGLKSELAVEDARPDPVFYDIERLTDLESQQAQWSKDARQANQALSAEQAAVRELKRKLEQLHADIRNVEALECCPTCMGSAAGWKDRMMESLSLTKLQEQNNLEAAKTRLAAAAEIDGHLLNYTWDELEGLKAEAAKAKAVAHLRHRDPDRIEDLKEQAKAAEESLLTAKARRAELEHAHDEAGAHHTAHQQYTAALEHRTGLLGRQAIADAATLELEVAGGMLDELRQRHESAAGDRIRWAAAAARISDMERTRKMADDAAESLEKHSKKVAAIEAAKAAVIESLFGPVMKASQALSEGLLATPLSLHPQTAQIGRWHELTFIPFPLLSGAEQLIAMACLQVALASGTTVILDEMGRMDRETKAEFLHRVQAMVEDGRLEQAILVDTSSAAYPEGWQIEEIG